MIGGIKVKSFTLAELIVVIIIAGIISGIAFSVLSLVSKQIHVIDRQYNNSSSLSLMRQQLILDFDQATAINWKPDFEELTIKKEDESVVYSFQDENISRNYDKSAIALRGLVFYYRGERAEAGPVDAVKISAKNLNRDIELFVANKHTAMDEMKRLWD